MFNFKVAPFVFDTVRFFVSTVRCRMYVVPFFFTSKTRRDAYTALTIIPPPTPTKTTRQGRRKFTRTSARPSSCTHHRYKTACVHKYARRWGGVGGKIRPVVNRRTPVVRATRDGLAIGGIRYGGRSSGESAKARAGVKTNDGVRVVDERRDSGAP